MELRCLASSDYTHFTAAWGECTRYCKKNACLPCKEFFDVNFIGWLPITETRRQWVTNLRLFMVNGYNYHGLA